MKVTSIEEHALDPAVATGQAQGTSTTRPRSPPFEIGRAHV